MASVELRTIDKSFGALSVIEDLNLDIQHGEFVALVGPSGCGKSTTLRIIAGLEEATAGDVFIGQRVVNHLSPKERNISMVFQNYALYPHMTVAKNLSFNLELSRLSKSEIEAKVRHAADLLEISNLLDRRPAQLSGGQRQRVAMGRAIVRNPEAFLFDEPLSNLDAKLRVQMRSEIKKLHQKIGTTSVYVTHDQVEAMTLADRVVVFNHGRIEQIGQPMDLYRDPANIFVAGFMGSPPMNFLEATVVGAGDMPGARLANGNVIPLLPATRVSAGQTITVGVRPEWMLPGGSGSQITGKIAVVEPTGAQTLLSFDVGGKSIAAVVSSEQEYHTGQDFAADILPERVYVFDVDTGKRL